MIQLRQGHFIGKMKSALLLLFLPVNFIIAMLVGIANFQSLKVKLNNNNETAATFSMTFEVNAKWSASVMNYRERR